MKTDSLFFQIFQTQPQLFFRILGESGDRANLYQFSSVEMKQTAFRIDGVFIPQPDSDENTVIFAEFQFQKDEGLYERLFSEIMLYLAHHRDVADWRAVVFYPRRSLEQKSLYRYRNLLNSDQFQAIYLEDFLGVPSEDVGIRLMQLIVSPKSDAQRYVDEFVAEYKGKTSPRDRAIIGLVETVMLYKYPNLTREEINAMFTISDLKQTRVYKDAVQEGIEEGIEQGLQQGLQQGFQRMLTSQRSLLQRQLIRKLGELPTHLAESMQSLSLEQLETLGEALFDFETPVDFEAWLSAQIGTDGDRPKNSASE